MRDLTAGMLAEITADHLSPILLIALDYDSGILRAWTGIGDLVWGGDTYLGVGHLLSVGGVGETTDTRAEGVSLTLTGVPQSRIAEVLGEHYQGRPARMWLAVLDDDGAIVAAPELLLEGRMDTVTIDDSAESAVITQQVESELIDMRRPRGIRYTDEAQKELYPGDRGLEFVAGLRDAEIRWGR